MQNDLGEPKILTPVQVTEIPGRKPRFLIRRRTEDCEGSWNFGEISVMIPVSPGFKEYRETDMKKYLSEILGCFQK